MKLSPRIDQLYETYYVERGYEQLDLFRLIQNTYAITRVIYPGSYVHISPSFIFPDVVYIDSDNKAKRFFKSATLNAYIRQRKEYPDEPTIRFYGRDYHIVLEELSHQFDLLVSQYAGFISDACKAYLNIGGILLVNNSHGDAGLASIDEDYQLIATVHKSQGTHRISTVSLEQYFIPKRPIHVTKGLLFQTQKGVGYTKSATRYIFQRVS